jgi:hypothetical protein
LKNFNVLTKNSSGHVQKAVL